MAPARVLPDNPGDGEARKPTIVRHPQLDDSSRSQGSSGTSSAQTVSDSAADTSSTGQLHAELLITSWIIFFSILGTLGRLGVQALATYPNAPFPSTVLWANFGGCLFMGFLLEDRRFFRYIVEGDVGLESHQAIVDKAKKTSPLYIGLATGFCGSFTSFSTVATDAFLTLVDALPVPSSTMPYGAIATVQPRSRNAGFSFIVALGVLIIQTSVSLAGFEAGAHIALATESRSRPAVATLSYTRYFLTSARYGLLVDSHSSIHLAII